MKCKCGRQTNDSSGICAICNLKANDPDTIQGIGTRSQGPAGTKAKKHKGQKKNNVPKRDLICIQCQKPYKPTSSAQKRCPACKKIHIAEYQKKHKNKTSYPKPSADLSTLLEPSAGSFGQPHALKKTHQPSTVNCGITGCKNPIKSSGMCNKHYLRHLKLEGRIGIRKTHRNSQASPHEPSAARHSREGGNPVHRIPREKKELDTRLKTSGMTKNQKQDAEPERFVSRPLTPDPRPLISGNGSLAQMLYASVLLDQQINSALKNGSIDTTIILDIRFRLGEVARESIKA